MKRDAKAMASLRATGWEVTVIWECETKNTESLRITLFDFLATSPALDQHPSLHRTPQQGGGDDQR
jgi:G:T-mismatch repair DNA endonuclease (very short patch repair protein)